MSIRKFVSIDVIIQDVYRDYRDDQVFSELDLIHWADDALRLIGVKGQHEEIVAKIPIVGHKGLLPCGFIVEQQVADSGGSVMYPMEGTMEPDMIEDPSNQLAGLPVDEDHFSQLATQSNGRMGNFRYYFNNNCIITEQEDGYVILSYVGVRLDENGYPMIPDLEEYLQAIKWFIVYKLLLKKWFAKQDVQQQMKYAEDHWKEYQRKARDQAYMPTLPEMENIKNMWVRLTPRMHEFRNFFSGIAAPEQRRNNPY